jgi:hypothetical protein
MHSTALPYKVALRDLTTGQRRYSCVVQAYDVHDAARRARARATLAGVHGAAQLDALAEPQARVGHPTNETVASMLAAQLDTFPLISGVRA